MKIATFNLHQFTPAINTNDSTLSFMTLASGNSTQEHCHAESESFYILEGQGRVISFDTSSDVQLGEVIHFKPFEHHQLINTGDQQLRFICIYGLDHKSALVHALDTATTHPSEEEVVYVTSTPPTPNGDLHVGHLAGPYLGADVHTRFLRMRGIEAYHISGSDDFQSYVVAKGQQLNWQPEQTANHFADEIKLTLDAMNIHLDQYTRPSKEKAYQDDLAAWFHQLYLQGLLHEIESPALFDSTNNIYLYEVFVKGQCPNCQSIGGGNICEQCSHPNNCVDMLQPISTLTNEVPDTQLIKRLHFPLHQFKDALSNHHYQAAMATRLRVLSSQLITQGLNDLAITHPSSWGVSVPNHQYADQTIWVWFEMAFSFLYSIREIERRAGRSHEKLTFPDNTRVVHFFGYDNAFYHTILFPAVYTASFPQQPLKIDYIYNEFYLLEGSKFSTSRQHAIWGKELLQQYSADEIRFYLALTRPEVYQTNFTLTDLANTIKNELSRKWQTWLNDLDFRFDDEFNRIIPDLGLWTTTQQLFYAKLQKYIDCITEAYSVSSFSLQSAVRLLCDLVREASYFSTAEQHWRETPVNFAYYRTAIALEIAAAKLLAQLSAPIMPDFAKKLWQQFGGSEEPLKWPAIPPLTN